jgi:hypothetical protein
MRKLNIPQRKFAIGEESPTPLGLANGVGNGTPCNPLARWGIELQRKAPAKKKGDVVHRFMFWSKDATPGVVQH